MFISSFMRIGSSCFSDTPLLAAGFFIARNLANFSERERMGPGHTSGPDHSHRVRVFAREVLGRYSSSGTDTKMLQVTVIYDRERFAVLRAEK